MTTETASQIESTPMATLSCKGRTLMVDAVENHLIPIVFNNLSGANFSDDKFLWAAYLSDMSKLLPSLDDPMPISAGDGPLEVLMGGQVIASCMVGDLTRITQNDMDRALNRGTDRLWWIADNEAEADEWLKDLVSKGCTLVKKEAHAEGGRVDLVFSLNKARAIEVLGYVPDEEEWLEAETPEPTSPERPRG